MEVYTVSEVAVQLSVSDKTVLRLLESGRLRGVDVGNGRRTWRIPKESLTEFVNAPTVAPQRRRTVAKKLVVDRHF